MVEAGEGHLQARKRRVDSATRSRRQARLHRGRDACEAARCRSSGVRGAAGWHHGVIKVIKSLDKVFGLDHEAVKAARQWRFLPGRRLGQPVPVFVTLELMFTLR